MSRADSIGKPMNFVKIESPRQCRPEMPRALYREFES